ncbi:MAG: hypothetical protein VXW57_06560, partial [Pseudomonadota bacterium]|nr:hypothetical protein [Pseudomonadota bacterium]
CAAFCGAPLTMKTNSRRAGATTLSERSCRLARATVVPGATRTDMRAKAYPGEDPKTVKDPAVVADRLVELLVNDFDGCHRERVEG